MAHNHLDLFNSGFRNTGNWLRQIINILSNIMSTQEHPELPYLAQTDRLKIYQHLVDGCHHLWSKNKLQEEKALAILKDLYLLGANDPYFLAHLTAWVYAQKNKSKDLQVLTLYANALSSADGRPFSAKSKYKKPDLRYISSVLLNKLDPKQALRVRKLGALKWGIPDKLRTGTHYPTVLNTGFKKYLKYREGNINSVIGIVRASLGGTYRNLYRWCHLTPSDEVAGFLHWMQKDRKIDFVELAIDYKGKSDLEIAESIRADKTKYFAIIDGLSKVKKKMSPVIAVALLEQVTGNQAVILRSLFEEQGILKDPEVLKLYEEKIKEAQTALDRAEGASKTASEEVKRVLMSARAAKRKEQMGDVGKIFLHVDCSISMRSSLEYAQDNAAIIAEMVDNPKENFGWGLFKGTAESGELLIPEDFEKDAFKALLFGKDLGGSTDCFALYAKAREKGAEVDIFVSDGEHNVGPLGTKIRNYHEQNPFQLKPRAVVLIRVTDNSYRGTPDRSIEDACMENGIPYAEMKPETLNDSALVTSAVKQAVTGPSATIDDIMDTKLPKYPRWWYII